jgi:hypothetical protein
MREKISSVPLRPSLQQFALEAALVEFFTSCVSSTQSQFVPHYCPKYAGVRILPLGLLHLSSCEDKSKKRKHTSTVPRPGYFSTTELYQVSAAALWRACRP